MYKVNGIFYYKIFLYSTGNYNFLHMLERLNGDPLTQSLLFINVRLSVYWLGFKYTLSNK